MNKTITPIYTEDNLWFKIIWKNNYWNTTHSDCFSYSVFFYLRIAENKEYKEAGSLLIEKVEKHKINYGKLPETVSDLHIKFHMERVHITRK